MKLNRSKNHACESLIENGFLESTETDEGQVALRQNHFKWDKVCPLFLSCIPSDRSQFAKSSMMKEHQFIMQVNWLISQIFQFRSKYNFCHKKK